MRNPRDTGITRDPYVPQTLDTSRWVQHSTYGGGFVSTLTIRVRRATALVVALGLLTAGCTSGDTTSTTGPTTLLTIATTSSATTPSNDALVTGSYPIVDTGQTATYDASSPIPAPAPGEAFYGQDAQYDGNAPSYTDNADGTVTDNVTGLMWTQSLDLNGDGEINVSDKLSYANALASAASVTVGGYDDWRLPTIKELYSLIEFTGVDPSGYEGTDVVGLIPFIDTSVFAFGYGDTANGERVIDAQMATSTLYVDVTAGGQATMFGVNFADGRIKGYGLTGKPGGSGEKLFYVYYVRGASGYGVNDLHDNGDGTITDAATGLMWAQDDSGTGMNWEDALAWAQRANAESYRGYDDWRLPNVKELQSIVDYTRSPGTTDSAAIDPIFSTTAITNEAGQADYPAFWSSTTHVSWTRDRDGAFGAYVAFGRAMGYMNGSWVDVHGAGAQRSDPKTGSASDYPTGRGPQGDAIRIDNFVRLVRDAT